jgi:hypothetical protein
MIDRGVDSPARRRMLGGLVAAATALLASPAVASALSALAQQGQGPRTAERALVPQNDTAQVLANSPYSELEQLTIVRLVGLILPNDGNAGAADVGTDVRVLFALENQDPTVRVGIQQALAAINGIAMQLYGRNFVGIDDVAARQVTSIVANNAQLGRFWYTVRTLSVLDFYATPQAYLPLGNPGPSIDTGGFPGGVPRPGTSLCSNRSN